jgi:hypothetical protein
MAAEDVFVDGCAIALIAILFAAVPFAISGAEAMIALSPDGGPKTGSAASGLMLPVGTLVGSNAARDSSRGTETVGDPSKVDGAKDTAPSDAAGGSNWFSRGQAEDVFVDGSTGITISATPCAVVPLGISGDEAVTDWPPPDEVAKTGFATS